MARRTDARRRICVALKRQKLAMTIYWRLKDMDNGYAQHLLNRAKRYQQLAEAIAQNELYENPFCETATNRDARIQRQVDKLVNSMSGCLQT